MANTVFDRVAEDTGNIIALEHVNVTIPDQRLAALFYVVGMGFTRDPYISVGDENMWINVGRQQFHLPSRGAQVLRGHVGVVVPDLAALVTRLGAVQGKLAGTRFAFTAHGDHVAATCPWGNRLRCYAPGPRFGKIRLGIPYVEFDVTPRAVPAIARFYQQAFGVTGVTLQDGSSVSIPAGPEQALVFRATAAPPAPYDGHHVAIYVADFSGPHRFLRQHDLVTEESDAHQYRFRDIFDLETGDKVFEIEHEVRSLTHPMWRRAFVNRNPDQTQRTYMPGRDTFAG